MAITRNYITIFLLVFLFLIVIVYILLCVLSRKKLYNLWNKIIERETNNQNETDRASKYLTSLQSAWVCQNHVARSLHLNIVLSHNEVLEKINSYFRAMTECAEESNARKEEGVRYFPFVTNGEVNSLIHNFGLSDVRNYVYNLGLYIIEPGSETSWLSDFSKGLYKYHYGLVVPDEGEFGLYIKDVKKDNSTHRVKWKSRQGFIWDATFEHRLANNSDKPCLIIVADIQRNLSWKNQVLTSFLHTYFPPN